MARARQDQLRWEKGVLKELAAQKDTIAKQADIIAEKDAALVTQLDHAIKTLVDSLFEVGLCATDIKTKIMTKYNLSDQQADTYIQAVQ